MLSSSAPHTLLRKRKERTTLATLAKRPPKRHRRRAPLPRTTEQKHNASEPRATRESQIAADYALALRLAAEPEEETDTRRPFVSSPAVRWSWSSRATAPVASPSAAIAGVVFHMPSFPSNWSGSSMAALRLGLSRALEPSELDDLGSSPSFMPMFLPFAVSALAPPAAAETASRQQIAQLPVFQASAGSSLGTCSICLEDIRAGDTIKALPCLHKFHATEIDEWLRRSRLCPVCKKSID